VGRNHLAGTLRSVCQVAGDVEFPLGTFGHKLKGFHPTGYHLVYTECGRLAALDGAVEQRSVNQCAFVVALYLVGCFGIVTDVSFCDNFVLKSAGKRNNSLAFFVLFQELFAGFF
jgi:hypothetical protein